MEIHNADNGRLHYAGARSAKDWLSESGFEKTIPTKYSAFYPLILRLYTIYNVVYIKILHIDNHYVFKL